jgi:LPS sulfotransferase NodH
MKLNERLILLAWPRSGSSSLWKILQAHPGLDLMPSEPFNEGFTGWSPGNPDYLARIHDIESLDTVLAELFGRYHGIKVLSYQLGEDQLRHLILRPDLRIIFISRRNLLQTAVSDRIAKQAKLYNRWDANPERPLEQYYDSLEPLDLDDLRGYIRALATHLDWIRSVLNLRTDGHTMQLRYEDLYFAAPPAQRAQLSAVWSFLELAPLSAPEVDYCLDPRTAKLGGRETYGQLPNAAEIDASLGADETGWLFPLIPLDPHQPGGGLNQEGRVG